MVRRGLVGWWRFNEGAGAVAKDSSGKGNDGTSVGFAIASWVAGKIGTAISFDGVHNYIQTADNIGIKRSNLP